VYGERVAGVVRVLSFCLVVSVGLSLITVHSVYGDIQESARRFGRDMLKLKDVLGPPQAVHFNGATLYAGGRHVDMGVKEFLDRFQTHCEDRSAGIEEEFAKVPAERVHSLPEEWRNPKRLGMMRTEAGDREGALACIVHPEGAKGVGQLLERIGRFIETGDVSQIGHLRFVFAKKNEEKGGADVVTVWNDGPLNVEQILMGEGDAPGRDTQDAPRAPNSRRVISAEVEGAPYALRSYESSDSSEAVLAFYDRTMGTYGWQPFRPPAEERQTLGDQRVFVKNDAVLFVLVEDEGSGAQFEVVEMGTRGAIEAKVIDPQ
jgi:hypothetical protein